MVMHYYKQLVDENNAARKRGDYVAFVQGKNLFSPDSDWLGFLLNGNEVYDPYGSQYSYLSLFTDPG
jgi:hypothetical protein